MSRRFTIGRDKQCDVPVFDDSVSRLHAEIWLADDGSLIMADCGSANGTTVVRGKQKFPLRQDVMLPGDYVRMGSIMLSVQEMMEAVEAKFPRGSYPTSRSHAARLSTAARCVRPTVTTPASATSSAAGRSIDSLRVRGS